MESQVVDERYLKNFFDSKPQLQSHYFIINSLYDENDGSALPCDDVTKLLGVSHAKVHFAVDEINQHCPDALTIEYNPSYRKIAITELGRSVLQYDITKIVPQEGILADYLTKSISSHLLDEYLRNNWLYMDSSNEDIKYVRGEKYCEFLNLYKSLYQYNEANCLTNEESLVDVKWIAIIEGRFEIQRGPKFPSVIVEKLTLQYNLAVDIYNKNVQKLNEKRDKITQDILNMLRLQQAVKQMATCMHQNVNR